MKVRTRVEEVEDDKEEEEEEAHKRVDLGWIEFIGALKRCPTETNLVKLGLFTKVKRYPSSSYLDS